jgi:hypothetical protein
VLSYSGQLNIAVVAVADAMPGSAWFQVHGVELRFSC